MNRTMIRTFCLGALLVVSQPVIWAKAPLVPIRAEAPPVEPTTRRAKQKLRFFGKKQRASAPTAAPRPDTDPSDKLAGRQMTAGALSILSGIFAGLGGLLSLFLGLIIQALGGMLGVIPALLYVSGLLLLAIAVLSIIYGVLIGDEGRFNRDRVALMPEQVQRRVGVGMALGILWILQGFAFALLGLYSAGFAFFLVVTLISLALGFGYLIPNAVVNTRLRALEKNPAQ